MKVLIVNQAEVRELLPMRECIELMADALAALARGQALLPLRQVVWLPDKRGALAAMPSYLEPLKAMGIKIISVFPGNLNTQHDSHQGAVLLFDVNNGCLLSVLDATEITAIRTAAVSGVATRILAPENAHSLAILGSGVQAWTHLEAMRTVREISHVRVWSRNPHHSQAFASRASNQGVTVDAVSTAEQAVRDADLICTTTAATTPVLNGEWLKPGAHINAVGAYGATNRELDTAALVRSRLFVDRRESTLNESGDFLIPLKEGAVSADHILGELGEVLIGKVSGRRSPDEITLFKSMGIAIEDLASGCHIYRKALEKGKGTYVELGGSRHGAG